MPKSKQQKEVEVKELTEKFSKVKSVVFADLQKLRVAENTELRRLCRNEKIDCVVAKKTLLKRVLDSHGLGEVDTSVLTGSVATVISYGDEVAPAKILSKFNKEHEKLLILGGILEKKFVGLDVIKSLAQLPSKDELIAKVVGSIAAPLSGFVNVLQGNLRGLVYTLQAIKDKKSN
ncbi:MAG: 50S ribosomal protein L10 [Patescibacteria group bacterium]|jgi:large subunit ribosomal protein L10